MIPYFFRKLGRMSQNVSSAAVVIGALRVNRLYYIYFILGPNPKEPAENASENAVSKFDC